MATQQRIEWANRDFLRGLAVGALVLTLFWTAWAGAPAGILGVTPVATALAPPFLMPPHGKAEWQNHADWWWEPTLPSVDDHEVVYALIPLSTDTSAEVH